MSANHILQNFLSAENFPEWTWALKQTLKNREIFLPTDGRLPPPPSATHTHTFGAGYASGTAYHQYSYSRYFKTQYSNIQYFTLFTFHRCFERFNCQYLIANIVKGGVIRATKLLQLATKSDFYAC